MHFSYSNKDRMFSRVSDWDVEENRFTNRSKNNFRYMFGRYTEYHILFYNNC